MPGRAVDGPGASSAWLKVAVVGGALLLIVMIAELAVTLGVLQDSREHIESQDAKVEALLEASAPLAREARPLVDEAAPVIERAKPVLGDAASFLDPLADSGDELALTLDRFPLLEQGLRRAAGEALPLLEAVDPSALVGGATLAAQLLGQLAEDDRLVTALDRASALLAEVRERGLVDRAVQADRTLREVLTVQKETLEVQRQALEVQRRSLEIQRRSLDHIRSLDAKLLGEFPPD
ncbi:MAG TPA: hypothetical protein VHF58_06240 [Solirubrobacterales bacterium]|nr:hypothetical protein [Solirubrobacterales bacterium]